MGGTAMVQLVQTTTIGCDWEKAAGRVDEMHWMLTFDSLSEEGKWAEAIVEDDTYIEHMIVLRSEVGPTVDKLYRSVDFAWTVRRVQFRGHKSPEESATYQLEH
jgi:hypothetical protein